MKEMFATQPLLCTSANMDALPAADAEQTSIKPGTPTRYKATIVVSKHDLELTIRAPSLTEGVCYLVQSSSG